MEERLLGVSLTGIMDHPVMSGQAREGLVWDLNGYNERTLAEILTELKGIAEETNAEFADLLGIPRSKQITLVKVV